MNSDDDHYETLLERETEADKNYDTLRNYISIPIASTSAFQRQDGRPWSHGTIMDKGDQIHNDQSYNVCMTDRMVPNHKQQSCEVNTHHIRAVPQ